MAANPSPAGSERDEIGRRAEDRRAEGHARDLVRRLEILGRSLGHDFDAREHLPDGLASRGGEHGEIPAVQQQQKDAERHRRQGPHLCERQIQDAQRQVHDRAVDRSEHQEVDESRERTSDDRRRLEPASALGASSGTSRGNAVSIARASQDAATTREPGSGSSVSSPRSGRGRAIAGCPRRTDNGVRGTAGA